MNIQPGALSLVRGCPEMCLFNTAAAQTSVFYWKLPWRGGSDCKTLEGKVELRQRKIFSALAWASNRH